MKVEDYLVKRILELEKENEELHRVGYETADKYLKVIEELRKYKNEYKEYCETAANSHKDIG